MSFYLNLKSICDDRHIAMSALCEKCGFSPKSPTAWKGSDKKPPSIPKIDVVGALATELGVTTDYLIYGTDHNTSLTPDELTLLNNYRQLSASAKEKAQKLYEIFLMPKADKQDD